MIDRNVEFPNRFRMTLVPGTDDIYEVVPAPGDVIAAGDTFSKVNMLPDSIPALLGLKMVNPQVKDALNVLAHVGNLHVWMKTVVTKEPVPAGYTLGAETNTKLCYMYYTEGMSVSYASSVSIDDAGNVFLVSPASISLNTPGDTLVNEVAITKGKFVKFTATNSSNIATPGVYFIPTDATFTYVTSGTSANQGLYCDKAQKVNPYPLTPVGTTTDYLTSTDRNAYPDNVTDAQDAYYSLGDVQSLSIPLSSNTNIAYTSSLSVADDGSISTSGWTKGAFSTSGSSVTSPNLTGKYVKFSHNTQGNLGMWYIPSDSVASVANQYVTYTKAQPVTGHAAIPANTTITYLGQLGGGKRIEVGSYVGTRTYGSSNPNTLTFGFEPKIVFVVGRVFLDTSNTETQLGVFNMLALTDEYLQAGYFEYDTSSSSSPSESKYAKKNGNTLSWYSNNSTYQLNGTWSGEVSIYTYFAFA